MAKIHEMLGNSGYYSFRAASGEVIESKVQDIPLMEVSDGDECLMVWADMSLYYDGTDWYELKREGY